MANNDPLLKHRKLISNSLSVVFVLWSLYMITLGFKVYPPACDDLVFIWEAKDYYFEKSTFEEKEYRFSDSPSAWLSPPNVNKVLMAEDVGADIEVLTPSFLCYVIIDNQLINVLSRPKTAYQLRLYTDAIIQMSALSWENSCRRLAADIVVWIYFTFAFVSWIIYLDKTTGVLL